MCKRLHKNGFFSHEKINNTNTKTTYTPDIKKYKQSYKFMKVYINHQIYKKCLLYSDDSKK